MSKPPTPTYPLLRLTTAALLVAFGLQSAFAGSAGVIHFNIPAQSLNQALLAFSKQSGQQLLYRTDIADNLKSRELKGSHTAAEAIRILLGDAPLQAVTTGDRAMTLEAKKKPAAPESKAPSDPALPKVTVKAKAGYDANDPYNKDYAVPNATTATKTDTPIMETPLSIQVVPKVVLDDQQAVSLKDGLQNVSGVQWSPVEGNLYENFVLRGFDAGNSIARNGIRDTALATDLANIERLEVLKGPASILYGRIEPGGLINRVTKQPLFLPYYSLQQQFGSFDLYRTTVDATGPINQELAYRFNLAYQSNNSFRDFVDNDRIFLAPSLTWRPTDRTELGLTLEYQYDKLRWDDGIPAIGNRPANVPISRYLGDPISKDTQEKELVDFHWSHEFNKDWKINQRFVASLVTYHQFNVLPLGIHNDNRTLDMGLWDSHQERNTYSQNINLTGHAETWGAQHTILAGFDFYQFDQPGASPTISATIPNFDLYNSNAGKLDGVALHYPRNSYGFNGQTWYGIYFQDQVKLWDKLHLLAGGRYDWATVGTAYGAATESLAETAAAKKELNVDKFNPRFGIVYQPWSWASLYANYTESLGANSGRNQATNTPLKPQEAHQYEVGIKNEFFDGRLNSTLAFFEITKKNIAALWPDPTLALQGFGFSIGEARSRGIEYDLSGQLTENWSLIANYAYTDAIITKGINDGTGPAPQVRRGNRLPLAPKHSANLWIKYELTDGALKGLSFGTGARIVSQRQGDVQNDFQLPGYVTWNAMMGYKYKLGDSTLTAQLNAYNLLDKRYYAGTDLVDGATRVNIIPGAPINFMGSVRLEY
ncbi:MAG: TonB-dependent receptor [Methylococcaceae bacterium]|nr:TonB-dependent receptor [Methylococcaceae bacterium]